MECISKIKEIGYEIPVLLHSTAHVSKSAEVDKGIVVESHALINVNTTIGEGCIVSVGTIIDHNVVVEDDVHANAGTIIKASAEILALPKLEAGEVVLGYGSARIHK